MHSSSVKPVSNHFLHLDGNTRGKGYIVADLHGSLSCLKDVLEGVNFNLEDRLFIAGDFVDRGPDTLGLIELIMTYPNIYAVKGNHEQMVLRSINVLEFMADLIEYDDSLVTIGSLDAAVNRYINDKSNEGCENECRQKKGIIREIDHFYRHMSKNGGGWLVEYFLSEVNKQIKSNKLAAKGIFSKIKQYIHGLPYIIMVDGCKKAVPFNIVHADMPISDDVLKNRISSGQELTNEEIHHATWARQDKYSPAIGRNKHSILTYCGHVVVIEENVKCVRKDYSAVDLDVAAYLYGLSLVVNHTDRLSCYYGRDKGMMSDSRLVSGPYKKLLDVKAEIDSYLIKKACGHVISYICSGSDNQESGADDLCQIRHLNEIARFIKNRVVIHQPVDHHFNDMLIYHFIKSQTRHLTRRRVHLGEISLVVSILLKFSELAADLSLDCRTSYGVTDAVKFFKSLTASLARYNPHLSVDIYDVVKRMVREEIRSRMHHEYDDIDFRSTSMTISLSRAGFFSSRDGSVSRSTTTRHNLDVQYAGGGDTVPDMLSESIALKKSIRYIHHH